MRHVHALPGLTHTYARTLDACLLARPQHYIFPSGGDGLYLVVDEKSRFREDNFQKAMAVLQAGPDDEIAQAAGANGGAKKRRDGEERRHRDHWLVW